MCSLVRMLTSLIDFESENNDFQSSPLILYGIIFNNLCFL